MAAVLTRSGRSHVTNRLIGAPAAGTEFKNVAWGQGIAGVQATAANTDVNLFSELPEARVAGTSSQVLTTTTNDTYQVTATITATSARTVNEVALTSATAKPQTTTVSSGTIIGSLSATGLTVASATGFPGAGNYFVQIRTEVVQVTAGQGTTSWTVVRGANGSTAIATIAASDVVTGGNGPGDTAITNGDISVHADFANVGLANGDSIAFTIKLSVS